jgi:hypothetical protein
LYAKGALYAKIAVPTASGSRFVHVFNTHLQTTFDNAQADHFYDPAEPATLTRYRQLRTLKTFIDHQLRSELGYYDFVPNLVDGPVNHDSILLLGNFNINGRQDARDGFHGDEYIAMKRGLEGSETYDFNGPVPLRMYAKDLLFDLEGKHPVTLGAEEHGAPGETVLTHRKFQSACARMDYVFQLLMLPKHAPRALNPAPEHATRVAIKETRVEKFKTCPESEDILMQMEEGRRASVDPVEASAESVADKTVFYTPPESMTDDAVAQLQKLDLDAVVASNPSLADKSNGPLQARKSIVGNLTGDKKEKKIKFTQISGTLWLLATTLTHRSLWSQHDCARSPRRRTKVGPNKELKSDLL